MSETPENTSPRQILPEEKKNGIGLVGGTIAVTGGAVLGAFADKAVVDHSIKANLVKPYVDGIQAYGNRQVATDLFQPADGTYNLLSRAESVYGDVTHEAHDAFMASNNPMARDLQIENTALGKAKKVIVDARNETANMEKRLAGARARFGRFAEGAVKVSSTGAGTEEAAAKEFLKLILDEAEKADRANIAEKVGKISFLERLNPFSKGLHLSNGQKGWAVAAGTATMAIGAIGIGMAAKWLGQGNESTIQK